MTLLTRLQLTLAVALLVFAVLLSGCALCALPVQLAVIGAVAVLATYGGREWNEYPEGSR